MQHVSYIGIGSNMGDRVAHMVDAIQRLKSEDRIDVKAVSHFYETEPITLKGESSHWFINAVIQIKTTLSPVQLLRKLQDIEKQMGRERSHKWAPRTIDLDILLFDDQICKSSELTIPHPEMHKRRFVLEPLCELNGAARHPIKGISFQELSRALKDNQQITQLYKISLAENSVEVKEQVLAIPSTNK